MLACIFWEDRPFISSGDAPAVFALRLCILNHTTTWDDVRETLVTAVRFGTEALSKRAQGAS